MPTVKPKYGLTAEVFRHRFALSPETLKEIEFWIGERPNDEFVRKIEGNMNLALFIQADSLSKATPGEIRAALKELFIKSRELYELIQKTDQYTRQQIQFVTPDDEGMISIFAPGPLDVTALALVDLLQALDATRKRIRDVGKSGGRKTSAISKKSLESVLQKLFEQYVGMKTPLSPEKVSGCVEAIMDSLLSQ